jgi:enamine deaminase RidA (YjgF/YER057c/UK114 family)
VQIFRDTDGGAPEIVRAGNLIFIGGLLALDGAGSGTGDVTAQARTIFERLKSLLAKAGATLGDVVKHNVYFTCANDQDAVSRFLAELDRVRVDYFTVPGPVTTEIRCGLDHEGALLMVDAWAVVGGSREILDPPGHWRWNKDLPFVQGWKVGDMLFIGGQRPLDAKGRVKGRSDIEIQTDEAFRNLDTLLKAGGGRTPSSVSSAKAARSPITGRR